MFASYLQVLGVPRDHLTARLFTTGSTLGTWICLRVPHPKCIEWICTRSHVILRQEAFSAWDVANLLGTEAAYVPSWDLPMVKRQSGVAWLLIGGSPLNHVSARTRGTMRHQIGACPKTISSPRDKWWYATCLQVTSRVKILTFQTAGLCLPHVVDLVLSNGLVLRRVCSAIYVGRFSLLFQKGLSQLIDFVRKADEILLVGRTSWGMWCKGIRN
jgi:hypothetical protein